MEILDQVRWIDLPWTVEEGGMITSLESEQAIPFKIQRVYYMHHVSEERGGHAHIDTDQVVVAAAGSFSVDLSDGERTVTFVLDDPTRGLYMPRLVFNWLYGFSAEAVCLVLANTHYDISRSLRSWDEYRAYLGKSVSGGGVF